MDNLNLQDIKIGEDASISDLRNTVTILLNVIEQLWARQEELLKENQSLKDEINRLKGEQGVPRFKGKKGRGTQNDNYSSKGKEKGRNEDKEKSKVTRRDKIVIDKEVKIEVPAVDLPSDAKFTGYDEVLQQNVKLVRENILYKVAVYYSASEKRIIRGNLPKEYEGQYGSDLKSLLHGLHHVCDTTQGRLECLLNSLGIVISSGTISNILNNELDWAKSEQKEILKAGISCSDFVQTDSTSNKEKGERRTTHIFSGEYFSVYSTLESKSRLAVLHGLQGGVGSINTLQVAYNEATLDLLEEYNLSVKDKAALLKEFRGETITLGTFKERVAQNIPELAKKPNMFIRAQHAFALSHYYQQEEMPSVQVLLSDDAPEYAKIAPSHGLCWVHDARYYNKLNPIIGIHRTVKEEFMNRYWNFYQLLLAFRKIPSDQIGQQEALKEKIDHEFDIIFTTKTNYAQLDKLIDKTFAKKDKLLAVLQVAALPLHNNAAELAARRVVRKRDISLHTWSEKGTQTRDAFMSIVETAIKLSINPFEYIRNRICSNASTDSLATFIHRAYYAKFTPVF